MKNKIWWMLFLAAVLIVTYRKHNPRIVPGSPETFRMMDGQGRELTIRGDHVGWLRNSKVTFTVDKTPIPPTPSPTANAELLDSYDYHNYKWLRAERRRISYAQ